MKLILKHIILFLIQLIEKYEYKNLDLDEDDDSKKIIETSKIYDYEIETDTGWKPITHLYKTQPYTIWRLDLENGMFLEGADKHIVFDSNMNQIFIKDLRINYYIQTNEGLQKVINIEKFNQKISMYDITVNSNDHRFYSNGILSHNTTTISAFFAWYLCFHNDRNLAILANKQATSVEIVRKVTEVFKHLPYFLKPGIENIAALGMRLDNGCMLTSQATTENAQIGFTIHILYIDEFAHIRPTVAGPFWRSVYPTLASSEISQCIISSTPNGKDNLFYEIWDRAVTGKNTFAHKRVDYWEFPGHDDEKWINEIKANFGEEFFAQEFELKFDVTGNSLLSASQLKWIKRLSQIYKYRFEELEKTNLDDLLYRNLIWRNDFDPNKDINQKEDRFIISVDIAEGKDEDEQKDNDYNIANIYQVKLKSLAQLKRLRPDELDIENMFRIEQIGVYRDNIQDETDMAKVCQSIVFDQLETNEETIVKMIIEMNFNGKAFLNKFKSHPDYFDDIVMKSYHTAPVPGQKNPPRKAGFKIRGDKDFFCKLGKRLIKDKILIPNELETSKEFGNFGKVKKAWKGIAGHDDLAMSTLNISRFYEESNEYKTWLYDFFENLSTTAAKTYAARLLEEIDDKSDEEIDDNMWSTLYGDEEKLSESEKLKEIFDYESNIKGRFFQRSTATRLIEDSQN